jgi:hypothetical protein
LKCFSNFKAVLVPPTVHINGGIWEPAKWYAGREIYFQRMAAAMQHITIVLFVSAFCVAMVIFFPYNVNF